MNLIGIGFDIFVMILIIGFPLYGLYKIFKKAQSVQKEIWEYQKKQDDVILLIFAIILVIVLHQA